MLVDYDVFVNVPRLDTSEPWVLQDPATVDFQLRAGSVVASLHHPMRIAEEWSMVDNLSGGRVV